MKVRLRKIKEPEQTGSDLGFGTKDSGKGARGLNKDGSFNVIRKGVPLINKFETYHTLISMSWLKFNIGVVSLYVIINLVFASLFMFIGVEHLAGIYGTSTTDKFLESFFFSSQTLTTLGYGRISPISHLASAIAAVESMLGLLGFALVTGLLYGRFSRPEARIKYSENALIAPYKNITALMFRLVNERRNQLIEVEAGVSLSMRHETNPKIRKFFTLKLEITKINFFPLSWTVVHPIDEGSPLWGMAEEDFKEVDIEFISLIKAFDDAFSQTVYSRSSYKFNEVVWGAKFIPVTEFTADGTILNIDQINAHEKAELPVMQLEVSKEVIQ
jgi:inward rectifier potassium channel